jgi:hypothetical protein
VLVRPSLRIQAEGLVVHLKATPQIPCSLRVGPRDGVLRLYAVLHPCHAWCKDVQSVTEPFRILSYESLLKLTYEIAEGLVPAVPGGEGSDLQQPLKSR